MLTHSTKLSMVQLRRTHWRTPLATLLAVLLLSVAAKSLIATDEPLKADSIVADEKSKLQPLQWVIGQWRGVGQPRRGSNRGAWTEKSEWAWTFDGESPSFRFESPEAKFLRSGELHVLQGAKPLELVVHQPQNDQPVRFLGDISAQGRLVFSPKESPASNQLARITIRQAARGDRMVILYEKRVGTRFQRLAEVGYTRLGSGFGRGTPFVECVVTGGLGTIAVTHEGKTYYVCCSGCRDYFNEDPAEVLREYKERKANEAEDQSEPE